MSVWSHLALCCDHLTKQKVFDLPLNVSSNVGHKNQSLQAFADSADLSDQGVCSL